MIAAVRRVVLLLVAPVVAAALVLASCEQRERGGGGNQAPSATSATSASGAALSDSDGGAAQVPNEPPAVLSAPVKPRVYVKNRFVFVRPRPDVNADWLGFLWFGAAVELRSPTPRAGPGCKTFYAIEPEGFVCVDDKQATLSASDPELELAARYAPKLDQPAPHRYAESLGVELRTERPGPPLSWPALPAFFHEPRRRLLPLSTLAYVDEATVDGEPWLLSADLLWLKKQQVTPYPEITFHGVQLGRDVNLPVAFFRQPGSAHFRRSGPGKFERSAEIFALQSLVPLSGQSERQRGERYFQIAGEDTWVRERDAVIPSPRGLTPWGARVGAEDHTGRAPKSVRQTWLEVSVLGGWLLAFEGTRPVYATLISPGRGGIPQEGKNTLEIAATPLGTFPISGKLATVTLQAPGESTHSDVPWTQNFQKPYAIHTAYWHDNWGNLESGGCINVSPIDGKWLFDFSEPVLPPGWHAVRWQPAKGAPTLLVVHE